jgi:molybdate transport system permease protein
MDWQALFLSLNLAFATTLLVLLIGLPLALILSQKRTRFVTAFELLVTLPLVLPPTVMGFYFLKILTPAGLAFSFPGLLIASVIYSFSFAFQPFLNSFRAVERSLLDAARGLGAGTLELLFRVILPLALPGILSGAILAFIHTLGEFGIVLMLGGNIPGVTRTLSISIYDQIQVLDYSGANWTASFLVFMCLVALWLKRIIEKRNRLFY